MKPEHPYWGGAAANGAPTSQVHPLDVTTFKALVAHHINVPVVIHHTRKDFAALPKVDRDALKAGPYLTACAFKPDTTHRCNANAEALVLTMLDIDSAEDALQFANDPDALAELTYPYNFVAYYTANSTPAAPRIRLLLDVAPCEVTHHKRICAYLALRVGLSTDFAGSVESGVLSQPMYLPNRFLDEEHTSPVLCSRTNGQALDQADALVPDEVLPQDRTYAYTGDGVISDLAYLPLQDLTVADIQSALDAIDPDCAYPLWREVGAALRHQFRAEDEAQEAFEAWSDWSSRGSKFIEGEPFRKWRSMRPDATGRAPITIRTLFHHAQAAGWVNTPVAEKIQQSVEQWILACQDKHVLLEEGLLRISNMPFKNAAMEDFLLTRLREQFKSVAGVLLEKAALKKQLSAEKYKAKVESASSEPPPWLRPFYYITTANVFHNHDTGTELIPEAFDNTYSKELISEDPTSESYQSGRPAVLPRHVALNQVRIPRVDATIYCPRKMKPIVRLNGRDYLNTFLPSSLPAEDPKRSEEAGRLFCEHMAVLIPEVEYQQRIIDYICHNVQHPGEKIPWAAVIQSAEGVGKGFLGRILMGVFGKKNVKVIGPQVLESQWDDWKLNAMFAILEEIHIPGKQREAVMNGIKMAISDKTIPINKRNTSAFDSPNYTNYIGFTNFLDALHLKPTDRRWFPCQSKIQTEAQVLDLNATGHFVRMEPLLEELSGALRHWMMNHRIADDFPRYGPAPKTKYRKAIIENSKNPMAVLIEKLVRDPGHPLIGDDIIHGDRLEQLTAYVSKNNAKPSHYLRALGYERYDPGTLFDICGVTCEIYVNEAYLIEELGSPDDQLRQRVIAEEEKNI